MRRTTTWPEPREALRRFDGAGLGVVGRRAPPVLTIPGRVRSFFEQIGQFSMKRPWRQKEGTCRPV
jgi:hypothetical protein